MGTDNNEYTSASTSTPEPKIWERSSINKLLEMYKSHEELYDPKQDAYRDREAKKNGWKTIASALQCSCEEIKKKIHNLRSQFAAHLKLVAKSKKSGADSVLRPIWPYYSKMTFLIPYMNINEAVNLNDTKKTVEASPRVLKEGPPPKKTKKAEKPTDNENSMEAPTSPKVIKESPSSQKTKKTEKTTCNENLLEAPKSLENTPDECEIFGNFVGSELRQLKSPFIRKWTKRRIQKVLLEASEQDDA